LFVFVVCLLLLLFFPVQPTYQAGKDLRKPMIDKDHCGKHMVDRGMQGSGKHVAKAAM